MAELQFVENPTIVVVPPPNRCGRYVPEVQNAGEPSACGHRGPRAVLWLIFVEEGEEARREEAESICAACEPERFARLERWAHALR